MGIGPRELLLILLVALVVFGTKKLRNIGSDLGAAVRGFKQGMSGDSTESTPAAESKSSEEDQKKV